MLIVEQPTSGREEDQFNSNEVLDQLKENDIKSIKPKKLTKTRTKVKMNSTLSSFKKEVSDPKILYWKKRV